MAAAAEVTPGVVVIDKPSEWTSHDVVARMRRIAGTRKVGHAGTLDPMATGVLVLGIGAATRLLTYVVGVDKSYTATIRLGIDTTTDDADGEVLSRTDASGLTRDDLLAAVDRLTGDLEQVPSTVSAIKIDGKRAYARARGGEDVRLAARPVTVSRFEIIDIRSENAQDTMVLDLDVEVDVSSGTYVRALARDLGAALGVGGHLTSLRRTRVGPFSLAQAVTLEQAAHRLEPLTPADAVAELMPVRRLEHEESAAVGHGKRIAGSGQGAGPIAALDADGRLVAILREDGPRARPVLVMPAR
ncbi:MAG: tRNA pseudouridine(55) synthase TruB [Actinomycetales bacterium]